MFNNELKPVGNQLAETSDERLAELKQEVHAQLLAHMDLSAIERLDDSMDI